MFVSDLGWFITICLQSICYICDAHPSRFRQAPEVFVDVVQLSLDGVVGN